MKDQDFKMKLKVLGSSSSGNCYILKGKNESLILEAGVGIKEIIKGIGFRLEGVVGCLVSHEHGDHAKSVEKLAAAGIDIYATKGTFDALGGTHHRYKAVVEKRKYKVGGFYILPFGVKHDCNEPVGYLIKHNELGTLLFATDTFYLKYRFPGINHFLIECNYSEEILLENIKKGFLHYKQAERVRRSHFGLENLVKFFKANDLKEAYNIVLIHLSDGNSNEVGFKKRITEETTVKTYAADKGLELELKNSPF